MAVPGIGPHFLSGTLRGGGYGAVTAHVPRAQKDPAAAERKVTPAPKLSLESQALFPSENIQNMVALKVAFTYTQRCPGRAVGFANVPWQAGVFAPKMMFAAGAAGALASGN